ncbi:C4-dicarboxylate TRAP transporter substrate-binding protein [Roseovarius amoyensis]|uniref:C4-dicarboxylate TRAP transporter substrate-binding protein n=1 Tax=Roseovarius amoyensis TaxID=2211448 RepID=UPI000DBE895B|nr:C4-dicarboxylate TRAP transporter substrate-binding protein [Roseovarius amoyensis]
MFFKTLNISTVTATALLVAGAFSGGDAAAKSLTLNQYVLPKHVVVTDGTMPLIEEMKQATDGELDIKLFTGGTPLSARATLGGLQAGAVDAGMVILTYHPAELPMVQYLNDLAVPTDDTLVVAGAFNEFVLTKCQRCLDEFNAAGIVFTGSYTAAPLMLVNREVYRTPEDLVGKRVRVPGGDYNARWADYFGLSPINVGGSEVYEMMNRGGVDITLNPPAILQTHSLAEVAKSVITLPVTMHRVSSPFVFSAESWAGLSEQERRAFLDSAAVAMMRITGAYLKDSEEALTDAKERGIEVIAPGDDLKAKMAEFTEKDVETMYALAREKYKIDNPEEVRDEFMAMIEKWKGIAAETGRDGVKMGERLRENAYSGLDVSSYGGL